MELVPFILFFITGIIGVIIDKICLHKYYVYEVSYDQDQIYEHHIVKCSKCGKKLKRKEIS